MDNPDHACPDEPLGGQSGAYLLRCADLALHFSRNPTAEMRARVAREEDDHGAE